MCLNCEFSPKKVLNSKKIFVNMIIVRRIQKGLWKEKTQFC